MSEGRNMPVTPNEHTCTECGEPVASEELCIHIEAAGTHKGHFVCIEEWERKRSNHSPNDGEVSDG